MELSEVNQTILTPAMRMLPKHMDTPEARVLMLGFGKQESKFKARRQIIMKAGKLVPEGPAVSFWQMEKGGGILGVLTFRTTAPLALKICQARGVVPATHTVWDAMQRDDLLGAVFARLLILTDPFKLPSLGNAKGAWELYIRTWRPGKPHEDEWAENYAAALAEVQP